MRTENEANQEEPAVGPPRWVKVFAVVALIVVALFVIMLLSGHDGPARHL